MSLRKDLEILKKKEAFSLHMPGHKGARLKTDTTELSLTDNILNPKGSIDELEKAIAHIYDAGSAFIGTNGATGFIMSSMLYAGKDKKILLPRNSHQSIYKGLIDNGQEPVYLKNEIDSLGIGRPVTPSSYLKKIPEVDTAVFTSPTYEGYMENYEILKPFFKNKLSILDGAHGSHLYYIKNKDNNWMDLQIHSFHKTLGSMNQGAVVLSNLEDDFREFATFYQTSSPSFPIMLSMEDSIREMMKMNVKRKLDEISFLKKEINGIRGFKVIENDDPFKLLISVDGNVEIKDLVLWLEDKKGIFFELSTDKYILGILGFYDTPGNYDLLVRSLKAASRHFKMSDGFEEISIVGESHIPEMRLKPQDAFFMEKKGVDIRESKGMVSGVLYSQYPPGSPILVPGEVIDDLVIEEILRGTGDFTGCKGMEDEIIFVIK